MHSRRDSIETTWNMVFEQNICFKNLSNAMLRRFEPWVEP